jgi:hypothetical protein
LFSRIKDKVPLKPSFNPKKQAVDIKFDDIRVDLLAD